MFKNTNKQFKIVVKDHSEILKRAKTKIIKFIDGETLAL